MNLFEKYFITLLLGAILLLAFVSAVGAQADRFVSSLDPTPEPNHVSTLDVFFPHKSVGQMLAWGVQCTLGLKPTATQCVAYRTNPYTLGAFTETFYATDQKISEFEALVRANPDYDLYIFKYCYLDAGKPFAPVAALIERLAAEFPDKDFAIFSMPLLPLATYASQPAIQTFNQDFRAYIPQAPNILMFDLADIEAHKADGTYCLGEYGEYLCPEWVGGTRGGGHINKEAGEYVARYMQVLFHR